MSLTPQKSHFLKEILHSKFLMAEVLLLTWLVVT